MIYLSSHKVELKNVMGYLSVRRKVEQRRSVENNNEILVAAQIVQKNQSLQSWRKLSKRSGIFSWKHPSNFVNFFTMLCFRFPKSVGKLLVLTQN